MEVVNENSYVMQNRTTIHTLWWLDTYFLKAQRRIGGHELHTYEQVSGDHNMVWRLTLPIKMRFPLTYSYSHLKLKIRYVFDNLPRVVGL